MQSSEDTQVLFSKRAAFPSKLMSSDYSSNLESIDVSTSSGVNILLNSHNSTDYAFSVRAEENTLLAEFNSPAKSTATDLATQISSSTFAVAAIIKRVIHLQNLQNITPTDYIEISVYPTLSSRLAQSPAAQCKIDSNDYSALATKINTNSVMRELGIYVSIVNHGLVEIIIPNGDDLDFSTSADGQGATVTINHFTRDQLLYERKIITAQTDSQLETFKGLLAVKFLQNIKMTFSENLDTVYSIVADGMIKANYKPYIKYDYIRVKDIATTFINGFVGNKPVVTLTPILANGLLGEPVEICSPDGSTAADIAQQISKNKFAIARAHTKVTIKKLSHITATDYLKLSIYNNLSSQLSAVIRIESDSYHDLEKKIKASQAMKNCGVFAYLDGDSINIVSASGADITLSSIANGKGAAAIMSIPSLPSLIEDDRQITSQLEPQYLTAMGVLKLEVQHDVKVEFSQDLLYSSYENKVNILLPIFATQDITIENKQNVFKLDAPKYEIYSSCYDYFEDKIPEHYNFCLETNVVMLLKGITEGIVLFELGDYYGNSRTVAACVTRQDLNPLIQAINNAYCDTGILARLNDSGEILLDRQFKNEIKIINFMHSAENASMQIIPIHEANNLVGETITLYSNNNNILRIVLQDQHNANTSMFSKELLLLNALLIALKSDDPSLDYIKKVLLDLTVDIHSLEELRELLAPLTDNIKALEDIKGLLAAIINRDLSLAEFKELLAQLANLAQSPELYGWCQRLVTTVLSSANDTTELNSNDALFSAQNNRCNAVVVSGYVTFHSQLPFSLKSSIDGIANGALFSEHFIKPVRKVSLDM